VSGRSVRGLDGNFKGRKRKDMKELKSMNNCNGNVLMTAL
jgi:hypothetical protein